MNLYDIEGDAGSQTACRHRSGLLRTRAGAVSLLHSMDNAPPSQNCQAIDRLGSDADR